MGRRIKLTPSELQSLYANYKDVSGPVVPLTELSEFPFDDIFNNNYVIVLEQLKIKEVLHRYFIEKVFDYFHITETLVQKDKTILFRFEKGNNTNFDYNRRTWVRKHSAYEKYYKQKKKDIEDGTHEAKKIEKRAYNKKKKQKGVE